MNTQDAKASISQEEITKNKIEAMNQNPELFPPDIRQAILDGKVILGMTPHQAQLAGGSCAYQVAPDPKWGANVNPLRIIQAQTSHPDSSHITLTFKNNTQYPELGMQYFKVKITQGKTYEIINVTNK